MLGTMLDAPCSTGRRRRRPTAGSWRLRAAVPASLRARVASALPDAAATRLAARLELRGVDWSRTRAFPVPSDTNGTIRLNVRGRERDGIVAPGRRLGASSRRSVPGSTRSPSTTASLRVASVRDGRRGARRRRRPPSSPISSCAGRPAGAAGRGAPFAPLRDDPPPRYRQRSLRQPHGRSVGARRCRLGGGAARGPARSLRRRGDRLRPLRARGRRSHADRARVSASVVVPTRDRPDGLRRCLAAVRAEERQPLEVVVVDDGSRAAGAVADVRGGGGARVVRLGGAARRRRGTRAGGATAEVVLLLDDDCVPAAGLGTGPRGRGRAARRGRRGGAWRPRARARGCGRASGSPREAETGAGFFRTLNLACRRGAPPAPCRSTPRFPAAAGEDRDWCFAGGRAGVSFVREPARSSSTAPRSTCRAFRRASSSATARPCTCFDRRAPTCRFPAARARRGLAPALREDPPVGAAMAAGSPSRRSDTSARPSGAPDRVAADEPRLHRRDRRPRRRAGGSHRSPPVRLARPRRRRLRGRHPGRRDREDGRARRLPLRPRRPPLLHEGAVGAGDVGADARATSSSSARGSRASTTGGDYFAYPLRAEDVVRRLGVVETARCLGSYAAAKMRRTEPPADVRGLGHATGSGGGSTTRSSASTPRRSGASPAARSRPSGPRSGSGTSRSGRR